MKNGRETLFLGQILTFRWHFITLFLASSPFVRTKKSEWFFIPSDFFLPNERRDLRVEAQARACGLRANCRETDRFGAN